MSPFLTQLFGVLAAAIAAAAIPAQHVWPANYATARGNAVIGAPFTVLAGQPSTKTRCTVIIDPASLPFPPGTVLTRLSLRRDGAYPNQGYAGATGQLVVRMGAAVTGPDQLQDVRFGRLWANASTQVFSQVAFSVPAAPAPGSAVPPFHIVLPFSKNYVWEGEPLAIDFVFTSNTGPTLFRLDAFAINRPQHGTSRLAGAGCVGSNGFIPWHYALPETTMPGANLTVQVEGGRLPTSPGSIENYAFHLLGLHDTTYQGTPLPIELSTFGARAGCWLRVDPLAVFTVPVSNPSTLFARARHSISLPAHPALVGSNLYSQWLLADTGHSAQLPLIASDAIVITLGQVPPPVAGRKGRTVWKYGASGQDNESGRMVPDGYAPIIRFN